MSESLRNDGRVWVPKTVGDKRLPHEIPEAERDYFLERKYPAFGNLVPRDVAARSIKQICDKGHGVGLTGLAVYLDLKDAIERKGKQVIKAKYGNLFQIYEKITHENAYLEPMKIYPAAHYTMGGLWIDYNLMTTIPGLYALGEINFSEHGANRLGASALMQTLAEGYFILPHTIAEYLATMPFDKVSTDHPAFKTAEQDVKNLLNRLLKLKGNKTVDEYHKELGLIMWDYCGMSRSASGLRIAQEKIKILEGEFWDNLNMVGTNDELNQTLEKAIHVADFMELSQLMVKDALHRNE
jgi:succinate dehydrogenase / fumarate reductase flavoprotein subunit